jgi:hypothetical protein
VVLDQVGPGSGILDQDCRILVSAINLDDLAPECRIAEAAGGL